MTFYFEEQDNHTSCQWLWPVILIVNTCTHFPTKIAYPRCKLSLLVTVKCCRHYICCCLVYDFTTFWTFSETLTCNQRMMMEWNQKEEKENSTNFWHRSCVSPESSLCVYFISDHHILLSFVVFLFVVCASHATKYYKKKKKPCSNPIEMRKLFACFSMYFAFHAIQCYNTMDFLVYSIRFRDGSYCYSTTHREEVEKNSAE